MSSCWGHNVNPCCDRDTGSGGGGSSRSGKELKRPVSHVSSTAASSSLLSNSQSTDKIVDSFERRWKMHIRDTASWHDFQIHRTVGVGAFGRVLYVRHKNNKYAYALKIMAKEKIVRTGQVDRVMFEKRILQSVVHPFLVNLRFVFKTNSYLCIVMPFVRGGEILSYMRVFHAFSEYQTQFYAAQVVLALQYLHTMRIVYRDLKPENVLLECDGYIKITDFGFAKRLEGGDDRTKMVTTSFVGTPEYMAPEMLIRSQRRNGYSFSVDWWSLGVFIYESAAGSVPFSGSSLLVIFDRIVRGKYDLPDHFSIGMSDLVEKLFVRNVSHRIGCGEQGAEEIKTHHWFANMNWQALIEKKVPSEFVPHCSDDDPTINYDKFHEEPIENSNHPTYVEEFQHF